MKFCQNFVYSLVPQWTPNPGSATECRCWGFKLILMYCWYVATSMSSFPFLYKAKNFAFIFETKRQ